MSHPDVIRRHKDWLVRRIVRHAWERVPYYARLMRAAGVRPEDIGGAADLYKIPVTRKQDLQGLPVEDLLARGVDRRACHEVTTAGSTGEPLTVLRTQREQYQLFAVRLRAQAMAGMRPWHTRVKLGSPPSPTLLQKLGLYRMSNLPLGMVPEEIIRRLRAKQPDVLIGIPTMLEMIVAAASEDDLCAIRPRLLFCGAEMLSPAARMRIEQAFGRRVVEFYGSNEFNLMAWQCLQCGHFHTCDDAMALETVEGAVIVTGLRSMAMPLIRYDMGDVVRRPAQEPRCGIGFGTIAEIQGRRIDFLQVPEGGHLNSFNVIVALSGLRIRRFQVVQETPERVVVLFVPVDGGVAESAREIEAACQTVLPESIGVEARAVSELAVTAAGKARLVRLGAA